jgi:hypothetical protein
VKHESLSGYCVQFNSQVSLTNTSLLTSVIQEINGGGRNEVTAKG